MMNLISVIVPVYNVEPYLRQCIDSILNQTYTDFELILVDDGSTDRCPEICDKYKEKDDRVRVLHKTNGGLSDARNHGIDISRGEYITFIDSDDIVSKYYLEILFNALNTNHAALSSCQHIIFERDDDIVQEPNQENNHITILSGKDACIEQYMNRYHNSVYVMAWGKLYKKDLFENIRFPTGKICEDEATVPIVLYKADCVSVCSEKLYFYRKRIGSIMHSQFNKKRFDACDNTIIAINYFSSVRDKELEKIASDHLTVINANLVIDAFKDNKLEEIPIQYKMNELHAWKIQKAVLSEDDFSWKLSLFHPVYAKLDSYINKIKRIVSLK